MEPCTVWRRRFLAGSLVAGAASLLAACAPASPAAPAAPTQAAAGPTSAAAPTRAAAPTTAPAAAAAPTTASAAQAASGGPVTLSIIGVAGHPAWDATKKLIPAYKEKNPQVDFKLSEFEVVQLGDKVNADFQAKQGDYDVLWMNSGLSIGHWVATKTVTPLDDLITSAYDVNDLHKLARNIGAMQGQLYGIAFGIEERMLAYRKDLLENAGLKIPTTVEEMTSVAEKLTSKDKNQFGLPSASPRACPPATTTWAGSTVSAGCPSTSSSRPS